MVRIPRPIRRCRMSRRRASIAFNVVDARGRVMPYEAVEARAREAGISVRGGCFCNPGAAERAFGMPAERARGCLEDPAPFTPARLRACLGGRPVGAVRMSLGVASNRADIDRLLALLARVSAGDDLEAFQAGGEGEALVEGHERHG